MCRKIVHIHHAPAIRIKEHLMYLKRKAACRQIVCARVICKQNASVLISQHTLSARASKSIFVPCIFAKLIRSYHFCTYIMIFTSLACTSKKHAFPVCVNILAVNALAPAHTDTIFINKIPHRHKDIKISRIAVIDDLRALVCRAETARNLNALIIFYAV